LVAASVQMRATICAVFLVASAQGGEPSFEEWAASRGKTYPAEELQYRRSIYVSNVASIAAHNAKNLSWTMGVNAFSDMAPSEFKARMTGGYFRAALR
jgi:hypothetical protein